jgi:trimeric autotransporter adhesin
VAIVIWKGDAQAVAQVTRCSVGGTIEADDVFTLTVGSKSISVTAGSTVAADVVAGIVAAWNALSGAQYPEFAAIAASDAGGGDLDLTAKTAGVPFTVTLSTTESGGGAADDQTFTQSAVTPASGGAFWDAGANWSSGSVPAGGDDVIIQNSGNPILYGLDQSAVTLDSLSIDQSFTGTIGLPRTNAAGYVEYRDQYLKIGATTITIGRGDGAGSGRIKIDTLAVQTTINVLNSGGAVENGVKPILWKGTHASNTVLVNKGSIAAAHFAGETAAIAVLKQGYRTNVAGDSDIRLGAGCSLGSCAITKLGGTLEVNSSFTSLTQLHGETLILAGSPGVLSIAGGAVRYKSAGTYTSATVSGGGELDFRQDLQPRTGTNTTLHKGAALRDPAQTVTFANPIALECELADVTLELGSSFNLQRS